MPGLSQQAHDVVDRRAAALGREWRAVGQLAVEHIEITVAPGRGPHDALLERDRRVFAFARQYAIPLAWVLAGGYTRDITKVVEAHLNTFRAAEMVYGRQA